MQKSIILTEGSITKKLVALAIPIMGTSFIQMAYNMTDMIWIGKIGSNAVAAIGTAGFFTWLAMAFIMISKVGAEVKVAQSIGEHKYKAAKSYATTAIQINLFFAFIYGLLLIIFRKPLLDFFRLGDVNIVNMAEVYLVVMALGMIFYFINPVFTSIFNATGDSKTPFLINTIGLIFNIVFDPLLIFGVGPFPRMEVLGAAIATVMAQVVVSIFFIIALKNRKEEFFKINIFSKPDKDNIISIFKLGLPVGSQSGLFTIFSILLARIISKFGPIPIAVQKVGSQIEAISWMTAGGFSTALCSFIGQNYGAKKYDRVIKGYKATMILATILGIFTTALLIFGGKFIFSLFISEKEVVEYGVTYLRILAYSQLFMCIEITTTGAFNGLGKTAIPSIISIVLTGLRVPAAFILSSENLLGLNGVWWSVSMSSVFKGILMTGIFIIMLRLNKLFGKNLESVSN